jgi:hypothetical protein
MLRARLILCGDSLYWAKASSRVSVTGLGSELPLLLEGGEARFARIEGAPDAFDG